MNVSAVTGMTFGNWVAIAAATISGLALAYNWTKDRRAREREIADRVRTGAARMLAKLNRWNELATWTYVGVQPQIIDAASSVASGIPLETVRDHLWKELPQVRIEAMRRVNDEDLESL